jgi:hypothetical protein
MANDNPHNDPAVIVDAAHSATGNSEPEGPPVTPARTILPDSDPQIVVAKESSGAPTRSDAVWLLLTLVNIGLFVFLVPADVLENKQLGFIIKSVSLIGAMGAFAAGLLWFKKFVTSLPERKWFRVTQIAALCVLIPLQVSQRSVVPLHPRVEPAGTKLEVDGEPRRYDSGTVRVSIRNHRIRVSAASGGHPREFPLSYTDVFAAIFKEYSPRWTPLYEVTINTNSEDVEVVIRKKDGEFDADFRANPPPTELGLSFEPQANAKDTFIYRGANNPNGSADHVNLPYGDYELTARNASCRDTDIRPLSVGKSHSAKHSVDFNPLCETAP